MPASTFNRDRARLGGLTRAALYDGAAVTAKARETFRASFLAGHSCKVCPEVPVPAELPPAERQRRADALYAAHYVRIRMAKAEKSRKATSVIETPDVAEPEVSRGRSTPAA